MPFAWWELVLILLVLLLVFGAKRLPEMGRSLGKGMREFKDSVSGIDDDRPTTTTPPAELPSASSEPETPAEPHGVPAEETERERVSLERTLLRRWLPRRLQHGEEATLVEHLDELRSRLIICLFAIVPAFIFTFAFHERIVEWLTGPLPDDKELVTFGVTEPFTTSVKVSVIAAIALVLPVLLWQVWSFFAPAVAPNFERIALVFVAFATGLFAAGVVFIYYVVLPRALTFLTNYDDELYDIQIRASYYYTFVAMTLLGGGLAFLMPVFVLALVRLRILTSTRLRQNRKYAFVILLIFAALLPTVDPVSLAFEIVPLMLLFEGSIWLAVLMERRWPEEERWEEELAELEGS